MIDLIYFLIFAHGYIICGIAAGCLIFIVTVEDEPPLLKVIVSGLIWPVTTYLLGWKFIFELIESKFK